MVSQWNNKKLVLFPAVVFLIFWHIHDNDTSSFLFFSAPILLSQSVTPTSPTANMASKEKVTFGVLIMLLWISIASNWTFKSAMRLYGLIILLIVGFIS